MYYVGKWIKTEMILILYITLIANIGLNMGQKLYDL